SVRSAGDDWSFRCVRPGARPLVDGTLESHLARRRGGRAGVDLASHTLAVRERGAAGRCAPGGQRLLSGSAGSQRGVLARSPSLGSGFTATSATDAGAADRVRNLDCSQMAGGQLALPAVRDLDGCILSGAVLAGAASSRGVIYSSSGGPPP